MAAVRPGPSDSSAASGRRRRRTRRRPLWVTIAAAAAAIMAVVGAVVILGTVTGTTGSETSEPATAQPGASEPRIPSASGATGGADEEAALAKPQRAVGVLKVTLEDPSRPTPARGSTPASDSRTMTVTIRYPISGDASDAEATGEDVAPGRFPLVVFAHGYAAWAGMYAEMEHELAAAGFVVAAPDFPLSSAALDGEAVRDAVEQASDVSFVIRQLVSRDTVPPPLLGGIATRRVAVIGQSDGGVTAAGVAYNDDYADPRIGAAVVLTGAEIFFPGSWFSKPAPPMLVIHGTDDEVNPFSASQQLYDDATGTKYLVAVIGGSHNGPFTTDPSRPRVSALVADFLRSELLGDRAARARLATDADVPEVLELVASDRQA